MKKYIVIFIISGILICSYAYAQAVATNIQMGFLTSSGCPGSAFTCFKAYSSVNPLPVQLAILP